MRTSTHANKYLATVQLHENTPGSGLFVLTISEGENTHTDVVMDAALWQTVANQLAGLGITAAVEVSA